MRLSVSHRTLYRYERPARFVTQSHRLTPRDSAGQQVVAWTVSASGAAFGARFTDGAGDAIATLTHAGPVAAIEIRVEGVVETADTAGVLRGHAEVISPLVYLRATPATGLNRPMLRLAELALAGADAAPDLERAHLLAGAVADAIEYAPGATVAHTTAAEAIELGRGVCQDHTHAMIALARAAGLPARYVTGYMFTGDADGGEAGRDKVGGDGGDGGGPGEASHAWAEVHVSGLGWVGFDAANRCCPDARYIRVGSGRDAQEAAPIRGVSLGEAETEMEVEVVVAHSHQQQ